MREDVGGAGHTVADQQGEVATRSRSACVVCGQEIQVGYGYRLRLGRVTCLTHTDSWAEDQIARQGCSPPAEQKVQQDGER
jgi:hypothetical protein